MAAAESSQIGDACPGLPLVWGAISTREPNFALFTPNQGEHRANSGFKAHFWANYSSVPLKFALNATRRKPPKGRRYPKDTPNCRINQCSRTTKAQSIPKRSSISRVPKRGPLTMTVCGGRHLHKLGGAPVARLARQYCAIFISFGCVPTTGRNWSPLESERADH